MNLTLIRFLIFQYLITINLVTVFCQDQSNSQLTYEKLIKTNFLEFGITPRTAGQVDRKIAQLDSSHYSFYEGIIRLQLGLRVKGNHYVHLCYDHFFRRLSQDFPFERYSEYNGTGISIQYNHKMRFNTTTSKIRFFGRRISLCYAPENFAALGLTNLRSGSEYSSVRASDKWFPYWSVGTGFGIRPSRYFELIILYQLEYYPSIRSYPFRNIPQTKFNFRI
jgi:hypothetical protein